MITPKNLIRHEFIGLPVKIVDSTNKCNVGVSGVIVDETMKTLVVKTKRGTKRIGKGNTKFMFKLKNKNVMVDGKRIVARPENRVKIKVKKW